MESRCQYLDWDSQFFSCRIASVSELHLCGEAMAEIENWCKTQRIDCLYWLADIADSETIRWAEQHHFRLVDIRLTLAAACSVSPAPAAASNSIRLSCENDIPILCNLARVNHRDSRFYFDGNFPKERCDALYDTWSERSCRGYADAVFVPEVQGKAAGYISCHLKADGAGQIGLVGLAPEARGKGLGTELVQTALNWFRDQGARRVSVVTQGRNIAAQKLYQRSGFVSQSVQVWYHRWFFQNQ